MVTEEVTWGDWASQEKVSLSEKGSQAPGVVAVWNEIVALSEVV
jgi:hypothetical protein